jgi:hypothetical protein
MVHPRVNKETKLGEYVSSWYHIKRKKSHDRSVGVVTRYGTDGKASNAGGGGGVSALIKTGPGAHPASYTMGTGSLPRG